MPTHTASPPRKMNTVYVKRYIMPQDINGKINLKKKKKKSLHAAFSYIYTSLSFGQHCKVSLNAHVTHNLSVNILHVLDVTAQYQHTVATRH